MASPPIEIKPPMARAFGVGLARAKKTMAHKKPRGTLQRCIHVPPRRIVLSGKGQTPLRMVGSQDSKSFTDRLQYTVDFNVHANPFVTGAAMAVNTTTDVRSFNTYIFRSGTSV